MQTLETVINFVSGGTGGGGGASQPELINAAATGDALNLLFIIAAIICSLIAVGAVCWKKHVANSGEVLGSVRANIYSVVTVVFAVLTAILLVVGVLTNSNKAIADATNNVEASTTIEASVNETTGEITFGEGWIKQVGVDPARFTGINVEYIEGITITDPAKWQVLLDDESVYNDVSDQPVTGLDIPFTNSTLNFDVNGLSVESAKSLIGKDVLKLTLLTDIVLTPEQEEADDAVVEETEDFEEMILDAPAVELLSEDKDELMAAIAEAQYNAQMALRKTKDPAEIAAIQKAFEAEVARLAEEAKVKQAETVAEKNKFTAEKKAEIKLEAARVTNDAWLSADQKSSFSQRLQNTEQVTLAGVANSTSRADMQAAEGQTSAEISAVTSEAQAASSETETQIKTEASQAVDTKAADVTKNLDDTDLFPENFLYPDAKSKLEGEITRLQSGVNVQINGAKSPEEVNKIRSSFEEKVDKLYKSAQDECKEIKQSKDAASARNTATVDAGVEKITDDTWVSQDVKEPFLSGWEEATDLNEAMYNSKSQTDRENAQKSFDALAVGIDTEFAEVSKKTAEEFKTAVVNEAKDDYEGFKKTVDDYGLNLWAEIKEQVKPDAEEEFNSLNSAVGEADTKPELDVAKKSFWCSDGSP